MCTVLLSCFTEMKTPMLLQIAALTVIACMLPPLANADEALLSHAAQARPFFWGRGKRDITNGELEKMLLKATGVEYVKDEEVHSGQDAEVYLMHPINNPKAKVAVKVDKGKQAARRGTLKTEIETLRKLQSLDGFPKLIFPKPENTAMEVGIMKHSNGQEFQFLIEKACGPDLATLLIRKKINIEQAKHVIIALVRLIAQLHAKDIVHADTYVNNMCVDADDPTRLILIDFGAPKKVNDLNKGGTKWYVNEWVHILEFITFLLEKLKFPPIVPEKDLVVVQYRMAAEAGMMDTALHWVADEKMPSSAEIAEKLVRHLERYLAFPLTSWTKDEKLKPPTTDEVNYLKGIQQETG